MGNEQSAPPATVIVGSRRLAIKKKLGEGGFAAVFLAEDAHGSQFVLKRMVVRRENAPALAVARRELAALRQLGQHPNIAALLDLLVTGDDGETPGYTVDSRTIDSRPGGAAAPSDSEDSDGGADDAAFGLSRSTASARVKRKSPVNTSATSRPRALSGAGGTPGAGSSSGGGAAGPSDSIIFDMLLEFADLGSTLAEADAAGAAHAGSGGAGFAGFGGAGADDRPTLLGGGRGGSAGASGAGLPEDVLLMRWRDACLAVAHMHGQLPAPLCHWDIKPENLLLGSGPDGRTVARLCDFGSAQVGWLPVETEAQRSAVEDTVERCTTLAYRAPELCDLASLLMLMPAGERRVGPPADIWALGCVLYRLAFGRTPFEDPSSGAVQRMAIINGRWSMPPASPYSKAIPTLLAACLQTDPRKRPSIEQLLQLAATLPAVAALPPPVTPAQWTYFMQSRAAGGGRTNSSSSSSSSSAPIGSSLSSAGGSALPGLGLSMLGAGRSRSGSGAVDVRGSRGSVAAGSAGTGGPPAGVSGQPSAAAAASAGGGILSSVMSSLEAAGESIQGRLLQVLSGGKRGTALDKHRWVIKATSLQPGGPKPKYTRRLVLDAWETDSAGATAEHLAKRPLARQPVAALKAALLLLKLVHQGPPHALSQMSGCTASSSPAGAGGAGIGGPGRSARLSNAVAPGGRAALHDRDDSMHSSGSGPDYGSIAVESGVAAGAPGRGRSASGAAAAAASASASSSSPQLSLVAAPAPPDLSRGMLPLLVDLQRGWEAVLPPALIAHINGSGSASASAAASADVGAAGAPSAHASISGSASVSGAMPMLLADGLERADGLRALQTALASGWRPQATGPSPPSELLASAWAHCQGRANIALHSLLGDTAAASAAGMDGSSGQLGVASIAAAASAALLPPLLPGEFGPPSALRQNLPLAALIAASAAAATERLRLAQLQPSLGPLLGLDALQTAVTNAGGRPGVRAALAALPLTGGLSSLPWLAALRVQQQLLALLAVSLRACVVALQVEGIGSDLAHLMARAGSSSGAASSAGAGSNGPSSGRGANVSLAAAAAGLASPPSALSGSASARARAAADAAGAAVSAPRACAAGALAPLLEEAWTVAAAACFGSLSLRTRLLRASSGAASPAASAAAAVQCAAAAGLAHALGGFLVRVLLPRFLALRSSPLYAPFCEPLEDRVGDAAPPLASLPHFFARGLPPGAAAAASGSASPASPDAASVSAPASPSVDEAEESLIDFALAVCPVAAATPAEPLAAAADDRATSSSAGSAADAPLAPPPRSPYLAPESALRACLRLTDAEVAAMPPQALQARATLVPGNELCAECGVPDASWASVNLGITLCIACSGAHRQLGVHISQVRSAALDTWRAPWLRALVAIGNRRSNAFWEARGLAAAKGVAGITAPALLTRPGRDSSVEERYRWATMKYTRRTWVADAAFAAHPTVAAHAAAIGAGAEGILMEPSEALALHLRFLAAQGQAEGQAAGVPRSPALVSTPASAPAASAAGSALAFDDFAPSSSAAPAAPAAAPTGTAAAGRSRDALSFDDFGSASGTAALTATSSATASSVADDWASSDPFVASTAASAVASGGAAASASPVVAAASGPSARKPTAGTTAVSTASKVSASPSRPSRPPRPPRDSATLLGDGESSDSEGEGAAGAAAGLDDGDDHDDDGSSTASSLSFDEDEGAAAATAAFPTASPRGGRPASMSTRPSSVDAALAARIASLRAQDASRRLASLSMNAGQIASVTASAASPVSSAAAVVPTPATASPAAVVIPRSPLVGSVTANTGRASTAGLPTASGRAAFAAASADDFVFSSGSSGGSSGNSFALGRSNSESSIAAPVAPTAARPAAASSVSAPAATEFAFGTESNPFESDASDPFSGGTRSNDPFNDAFGSSGDDPFGLGSGTDVGSYEGSLLPAPTTRTRATSARKAPIATASTSTLSPTPSVAAAAAVSARGGGITSNEAADASNPFDLFGPASGGGGAPEPASDLALPRSSSAAGNSKAAGQQRGPRPPTPPERSHARTPAAPASASSHGSVGDSWGSFDGSF